MSILVLNCGSSSAKFAVIDTGEERERISGIAQRLGSPEASLDWKYQGQKQSRPIPGAHHDFALREVVELLRAVDLIGGLKGVGHRVVHGGAKFSASMAVTPEVFAMIEECVPLGPLHNPANILGITFARELFPNLLQIAVFDTAFHQTMPECAYIYPLPRELYEKHHIRRYGFHGTSHSYVSERAIALAGLAGRP